MRKASHLAAGCFVSGRHTLRAGQPDRARPATAGQRRRDGARRHDRRRPASPTRAATPGRPRHRPTDSKARERRPIRRGRGGARGGRLPPQSPDSTTGLFVLPAPHRGTSCGTTSSPCATIDLALGVGEAEGRRHHDDLRRPRPVHRERDSRAPQRPSRSSAAGTCSARRDPDCKAPTIQPDPVFSATSLSRRTTLDTLDIVETTTAGTGVFLSTASRRSTAGLC